MSEELYHHGIKGQKWGMRRWQNEDGSLTPEGYEHYGYNRRGISKHTSQRIKSGMKTGAKIGTGVGVGIGAIGTSMLLAANPITGPAAVAVGASYMGLSTLAGAMEGIKYGALIGGAVGAKETSDAKKYIKSINVEDKLYSELEK